MATAKIHPILPCRVRIDGIQPLNTYFKHNYKLIRTLEVDYMHSTVANTIKSNAMKRSLLRVGKKAKHISGLRLHKCLLQNQNIKDAKTKAIIKRFNHIQSISLAVNGPWDDLIKTYSKWILYPKPLKKFYFVLRTYVQTTELPIGLTRYLKLLLKSIKRKKLHIVKIMLDAQYSKALKPFLNFDNYPTSSKKLTINWHNASKLNYVEDAEQDQSTLRHLKNLETVHLLIPMAQKTMNSVLESLPAPSKLLATEIDDHSDIQQLGNLHSGIVNSSNHVVGRFNHLNNLNLNFKAQKSVTDSLTSALKGAPIAKIKIDTMVEDVNEFLSIGNLIGVLPKAESLVLRVKCTKPIDFNTKGCFEDFFGNIQNLQNLKKLKIYFTLLSQPGGNRRAAGFIKALGDCVENLHSLKELAFRFRPADIPGELKDLLAGLRKKTKTLRKLKMNFGGHKLSKESMTEVQQFLSQLENLEGLALDELHFGSLNIFQNFLKVINDMKKIKAIKMDKMSGRIDKVILSKYASKFLEKKGLRKLSCSKSASSSSGVPEKEIKEGDRIDLQTIVRRNPSLEIVNLPYDIYSDTADMFLCKWN